MIPWLQLARSFGFESDLEMFKTWYQTLSLAEIGERLKLRRETVRHRMKVLKIPMRGRGGAHNHSKLFLKLHRVDQRLFSLLSSLKVSQLTHTYYSAVARYKKHKEG